MTLEASATHNARIRGPLPQPSVASLAAIGFAVRADFRRLYPANAKTPTCCPSDDNRTKVTNSVTSPRSLWWHVGPYFWPADLTRTANPIIARVRRIVTSTFVTGLTVFVVVTGRVQVVIWRVARVWACRHGECGVFAAQSSATERQSTGPTHHVLITTDVYRPTHGRKRDPSLKTLKCLPRVHGKVKEGQSNDFRAVRVYSIYWRGEVGPPAGYVFATSLLSVGRFTTHAGRNALCSAITATATATATTANWTRSVINIISLSTVGIVCLASCSSLPEAHVQLLQQPPLL